MSWLDKISKDLEIFMGDGVTFRPSWVNAKKSTEWNVSTFEFPNLDGSLVDRKSAKGSIFPLELYFSGDDHLDVSEAFLTSAKDPRHWHLRHPYYGDVRVQPTKISEDNSNHNVTKISVVVQESILGVFPKGVANPTSELQQRNDAVNLSSVESAATGISKIDPSDSVYLSETISVLSASTFEAIEVDEEAATFQNLVNKAISDISQNSRLAIGSIVNVVNYPAKISLSAKRRLDLISFQYVALKERDITPESILSANERLFYEIIQGTLITTGMLSAGTPQDENDYETRGEVNDAILELVGLWNDYVSTIDNLQLLDPKTTENYVANYDAMIDRQDMLNFSISSLYEIALEAKQEFEIILEEDSNIILLTHRFYGLDNEDENLELFNRTNVIGLNEVLNIKKGRKIIYYV
ncbi:MAG: hypothetical protein S4CHLAM20_04280 [Chlamydiia bacterium]|nr:hypothetical protein [Chlamydiia bacterium]